MHRLLRSRPSRLIVALLCAFVLSRVPAQAFAEDVMSSIVKAEDDFVMPAIAPEVIALSIWQPAVAFTALMLTPSDAADNSFVQQSILRV